MLLLKFSQIIRWVAQNSIVNDIDALNKRIDGGVKLDANLFHSFQEFNVSEGGSVYFANPQGITDIFSRVTGNNPSNIFGKLGVLGDANLFLINPNGIVFGENASLDLQGSFVATTANGIEFGEQGFFSASNPETPRLLNVNPSALFFNAVNNQATIQNNSVAPAGTNPAGGNAFGLRVADGKSLLLVGGNVSMDGGELNAYGGRVELGGLAAPGNVNLLFDGDNFKLGFPENVTRADVSLTNQAFVFVEADGGGDIAINARNLDILQGSKLFAGIGQGLGTADTVAGDITLNATGEINVTGIGSYVFNDVRLGSQGNGGNITINVGSFNLGDGAVLGASTYGKGNAGNVKVIATDTVSLAGNAYILSTVEAGGDGEGGNININAATLTLRDGAQLITITREASDTQPPGKGDAGDVNVKATRLVDIAGKKDFYSGIFSYVDTGTGDGGNITIDSGSFSLADGAQLIASTYGTGNAGNVKVTTTDADINLSNSFINSSSDTGNGGEVDLIAARDFILEKSEISVSSARGGNIRINAQNVNLSANSKLSAGIWKFGDGTTGNIQINAKDNTTLNNSYIFVGLSQQASGDSGNIAINTNNHYLLNTSALDASTSGIGNAGDIEINASGIVSFERNLVNTPSVARTNVESGAIGNGGNIKIEADSLFLNDGGLLEAIVMASEKSPFGENIPPGQGNSGNIDINVRNKVVLSGLIAENIGYKLPTISGAYAGISPELLSSGIINIIDIGAMGDSGNIKVKADSLVLVDGAQINSGNYGSGKIRKY